MIRPCTADFLLATPDGLGLRKTWFPRVVAEAMLKSAKDGEIKQAPDPVTMISGDITWYNDSPDKQAVVVQIVRAPRSIVSQSPGTVVIHDAWSFDVGQSPAAVEPTIIQDTFGGKCQIDRDSVGPKDLQYGRVFYDSDANQSWVNIGLVRPGQSVNFRYLAACQTPGVWTQPDSDNFASRWEANARYTRLIVLAGPWPTTTDTIPNYPTGITVKYPRGVYSYFPPAWMNTGAQLDLILLPGGGGGEGSRWDGKTNAGGLAGTFATQTLTYGTDFNSSTRFNCTVGAGGKGGGWGQTGTDGKATTVTWTTPAGANRTLTTAGGLGGSRDAGRMASTNPTWGQSPGHTTVNARLYEGGPAIQPQAWQLPGQPPGGGGPAGGFLQGGANGADGVIWFNARNV